MDDFRSKILQLCKATVEGDDASWYRQAICLADSVGLKWEENFCEWSNKDYEVVSEAMRIFRHQELWPFIEKMRRAGYSSCSQIEDDLREVVEHINSLTEIETMREYFLRHSEYSQAFVGWMTLRSTKVIPYLRRDRVYLPEYIWCEYIGDYTVSHLSKAGPKLQYLLEQDLKAYEAFVLAQGY